MIRARSALPGNPRTRRTLSVVSLCIFAVLNQPLSLMLHGWQEGHRACPRTSANTAGAAFDDTARDVPTSAHDAATCPICRTASQAGYSLVVALHAGAAPLERERRAVDDERGLPSHSTPPADAPRAPPSLA